MSRWGGFRRGRRVYKSKWSQIKAANTDRPEPVADTPQEFAYTEAQGIWNLRSTMQFPKSNEYVAPLPIWVDQTLVSTVPANGPYSDAVSAQNATNFTVSSGSLPNGISINPSTGAITGTPTTAGSYDFTIEASNTGGSISKAFNITVEAAPQPPSFIGATTLSGSGNLSLPSGLQQADLVMVFMADDNNNGGSAPSGWTTLITENFTSSVWNSVWYKFMDATPDSTVSVPEVSAWIAVAFRNVDTTTPFDVTYQGPTTGKGSTIPIPSITTSSDNAMLVAFGGLDDDRTASQVSVSSPWTLAAAEDNDGVAMVAYYLKTTAGTESGGSFSTSDDEYVSYVFALKPA